MIDQKVNMSVGDASRAEAISAVIPGWSNHVHYSFFRFVMEQFPISRILMLGVYHGRDIAFIGDILKRYSWPHEVSIVGVDRFTADACADWPQRREVRTWEQEVQAPPPSYEKAVANTRDPWVTIIRSDDFAFLETTNEKFDMVYLDTSHDFATVTRQLRQVPRVCLGDALICGDDYSDQYTWGVKSAVNKAFAHHGLFSEWIWFAHLSDLFKS